MTYDPTTRILHLCIAVGVTMQMITSLILVHPKPGRLPNTWYDIHEVVGIILAVVVTAYWGWAIRRSIARGEDLALFPWFSGRSLAKVRDDARRTVRSLSQRKLPPSDEPSPLAAAMQGLGLLAALFLAVTGTILSLGTGPDGGLAQAIRPIKELHEAVGPLMWAYLVAHPMIGLLHQVAGHRSLSRMFGLR